MNKKFLFLFIFTSFLNIAFANIGFYGSEIDSNSINSGKNVEVLSNLVNRDNTVKAEIYLIYELRNIKDMSLYYETFKRLSFAPNEVKQIKDNFNFEKIPQGEYVLNVLVRSGSGAPLSFVSHDLNIINDKIENNIEFSNMPYLKIFYPYIDNRVRFELSYSNTGKPIVPNETFEIRFNIENYNLDKKDYLLKFNLRHSYSTQDLEEIYSQIITLDNKSNEFIIDYKMGKAGTYDLFVSIYDLSGEILLLNKEVRVVIMGNSGTIIDVFNYKDTYNIDEIFNLDVDIVGPADAVSFVNEPYLKLEIFKEDNLIFKENKILDALPFNPQTFNFNFQTNEILDFYKVIVTLGKDDTIYDIVELNYEPLQPQLIIDSSGRIYNPNEIGCFDDGICTEQEKSLGNCLDCLKIEESEEKIIEELYTKENNLIKKEINLKLIIIIFSLIILGFFLIIVNIYIRRKSK